MVRRLAPVLVLLALLQACASETQVRDIPRKDANWANGRRTVADGSKLKMIFDTDPANLYINRVDYKVYEGELYLWPVRGQQSFEPVEFTMDTTKLKLREPWNEHVYWVESANWDNFMNRLVHPDPLGDRVDRVKADVVTR